MYLRQQRARRGRGPMTLRRFLFLLIMPLLIAAGVFAYQNRNTMIQIINPVVNQFYDDGREMLATAQSAPPTPIPNVEERQQLANAAWQQASIESAVETYREIIPALPNSLTEHYQYTVGLIVQGELQEALVAAENTVTASPLSADAWAVRALALVRNERYNEAIASALRALEIDSSNPRARAYLAEAYLGLGQYDDALIEVEQALEGEQPVPEALYVRARLQILSSENFDPVAARADLEEAFALAPHMIDMGIYLAREELIRPGNDPQRGIELLEGILETNPNNAPARYQLGNYYRVIEGDYARAAEQLDRCVTTTPEYIPCQYEMGRTQAALDDIAAASGYFRRAIELGSTDPFHWWWAGSAESDLGNLPSACYYWQTGYPFAQERLRNFPQDQLSASIVRDYDGVLVNCTNVTPLEPADGIPSIPVDIPTDEVEAPLVVPTLSPDATTSLEVPTLAPDALTTPQPIVAS